jgi:ketosteroid isomerase-like protein
VIDRFGWRTVFECIHSAEEEARGKPDPAVYLSTAAALGVPASACVAIEDSLAGLGSARAAGMRCVVVPAPETANDPGFDHAWRRLDSLAELPEALACLEEIEERGGGPAMTRSEMEAAVHAYFDAVAKGDREGLLALFVPDLRWRVPQGAIEPYAGLHEGAEPVVDLMLGAVGGAFVPGSQQTEIRNLVFGDDLAVAETEMRATTPDGRRYRNDYTFFFEFRDGRIAEIREHVDTRYAAAFFGGGSG